MDNFKNRSAIPSQRRLSALLIVVLLICNNLTFAREEIVNFEESSLPILNDELRRINDDIFNLQFSDRGDVSAVDYDVTDLTTDGSWYDLNLNSTIGADAKFVILTVSVQDDATGSDVLFRKNGNSNSINISKISTQAVDVEISADLIVPVDDNGIIEYKTDNLTYDTINITVKGWGK